MEAPIRLMVGSTVYGFEDQLSTICSVLRNYGYEVLNSHIGTIKVSPFQSNLENCLAAVDACDVFLGIIRPYYGTGNIGELNITFEEIKRATASGKPYWFLVHRDVVFARQLLKKIVGRDPRGEKIAVTVEKNTFFDERTLDIYNHVLKEGQPITLRTGNWAQEFHRLDDALLYIGTQFSDLGFVQEILDTNARKS